MDLELHYLEVEEVSLVLRVEHSDFDIVISGPEKATIEFLDCFVCLRSSVLIIRLSSLDHSVEKALIVFEIYLIIQKFLADRHFTFE